MPDYPSVAPADEPILRIDDLKVYFDGDEGMVRAVDGLSFDVRAGRTLGIVGESGCGKSVTARAVLRIEERRAVIAGGSIHFRGREGNQDLLALKANSRTMRAIRGREIALIFQEPMTSFSPVHTVGNQIVEAIRLHCRLGKADARQGAIEQLAAVGTPHPEIIMSQYAWELSGGLRQRAMIAMALVCDPAILIADEPTTALDVTTQAQVLALLKSLQSERGMALILITHDLGVVAETADDMVVMYLGRVVEQGPIAPLFANPRHPYTQALIRSVPDIAAPPRTRLATLSGSVPHPLNRPAGCPFHPRCPAAMPGLCDVEMPPPTRLGDTTVSCHLYGSSAQGACLPGGAAA
jgi:peptide/nickel transport system ATP-binding protein